MACADSDGRKGHGRVAEDDDVLAVVSEEQNLKSRRPSPQYSFARKGLTDRFAELVRSRLITDETGDIALPNMKLTFASIASMLAHRIRRMIFKLMG